MDKWKENLAALVPFYDTDGGNATALYTLEGLRETDRRTIKWNLRRLAKLYCLDLEAARSRYGRYLECGQGTPIPFSPNLVLVPLKVRQVTGKNDGACGYFNPAAVEVAPGAEKDRGRSSLLLPGGYRILCSYAVKTVKKRLKAGEIVLDRYSRESYSGATSGKPGAPLDNCFLLERILVSAVREIARRDKGDKSGSSFGPGETER
jgi:hypothetical protein